MLTMKRMFDKIFGVFKDYREFTEDRLEEMRRATTAFNTAVNAAKAQQNIVIKKESEGRLACTVSEIAVPNEEVDAVLDKYEFLNTETFTEQPQTEKQQPTSSDLSERTPNFPLTEFSTPQQSPILRTAEKRLFSPSIKKRLFLTRTE